MNDRAITDLARLLRRADRGSQMAQELSGQMQPTFGQIVDIEDPERRGRVKVILDQTNPEFQTEDGEALRHDEKYAYVAAWEFKEQNEFELHKEELKYEVIQTSQRNYK